MTTKSDKLVSIIVENNFTNIIQLNRYLSNNSKNIGINKREMNRIISKNSDYFAMYFEANQQNTIPKNEL